MGWWFLLLFAALVRPAGSGTLSRADKDNLYRKATAAFERGMEERSAGNADRAREAFVRASAGFVSIDIEGGIRNGRLYYNIANCYALLGDYGRAILYYRRAERLIPGNRDLRANLAASRLAREDRFESAVSDSLKRSLFFWHYLTSFRARSLVFAVLFVLFWGLMVIRIFLDNAVVSTLRWAVMIVALSLAVSLGLTIREERLAQEGVVLAPEVESRKGGGEGYEAAFTDPLHTGTEFKVLQSRPAGEPAWYEVRLRDGRTCWLPVSAVELI